MNKLLEKLFSNIKDKQCDGFLLSISNENLYEFTSEKDNFVSSLSGFSGDTGSLFLYKNKAYLLVDGRFEIEAKKEINDKRIKIILIDGNYSIFDFLSDIVKNNSKIIINPKTFSISKINKIKEVLKGKKVRYKFDTLFFKKDFESAKKDTFYMSSAPLFLLDNKYVSESQIRKIKYVLKNIGNKVYITSNIEEIAFITNLRYKFCDINNHNVLFDSFMIIDKKESVLYIKDYVENNIIKILNKNKIVVKKYEEFYSDIKKINKEICLDDSLNNYYIYEIIKNKKINFISSPLNKYKSIKNKLEINNLYKCNLLDGIAITKSIYNIKLDIKNNKSVFKDEYEIKKYIDNNRKLIGKKYFLCPSFETIVAYKENSAICHYIPTKLNKKKVKKDSLLLIDSGGNYLLGSTDVTRTISLYSGKIPSVVKKHYSIVLNSLLKLSNQKFTYGYVGAELDILARSYLYNEFLDYNHGTGHGIGYISNIHEGPNNFRRSNREFDENYIFDEGQLTSCEPGVYFENKYGIRLENDILTYIVKQNKYADFLGFKTLTLCPFDRSLIDIKFIDKDNLKCLNQYNSMVYKKLSPYLNKKERIWLKGETNVIR